MPDCPGIYVWYSCLCIGKADIQSDDKFFNLLELYSSKFGNQNMSIEASLNFNLMWEGKIASSVMNKNSNYIAERGMSENSREFAREMLGLSQHLYYQPLYIGKAESSLKNRLYKHISEFIKLKDIINNNNEYEYSGEDDFAQRAVSLGYNEDQLCVYTMYDENIGMMSKEEIGMAISLVEMYLNRWSTPLLGRR